MTREEAEKKWDSMSSSVVKAILKMIDRKPRESDKKRSSAEDSQKQPDIQGDLDDSMNEESADEDVEAKQKDLSKLVVF